jgi:amino acid permease-like protein
MSQLSGVLVAGSQAFIFSNWLNSAPLCGSFLSLFFVISTSRLCVLAPAGRFAPLQSFGALAGNRALLFSYWLTMDRRGLAGEHKYASSAAPSIGLSFLISGIACAFARLCYAEMASSVPIAGSAYTYAYATLGEIIAWIIGWDLVLEYALGAATGAIGWSGYVVSFLKDYSIPVPDIWTAAPFSFDPARGEWQRMIALINVPAMLVTALASMLRIVGILYFGFARRLRAALTHFLCKTLPKVATEMALCVLTYNLTRVINGGALGGSGTARPSALRPVARGRPRRLLTNPSQHSLEPPEGLGRPKTVLTKPGSRPAYALDH